jgi:hypothetical protein
MNENDRTTLEQAIYEEMELTPGNDPLHPHALRCLPLQFCRIQGVQNRHCSQRRPEHGHLHRLPDPARS